MGFGEASGDSWEKNLFPVIASRPAAGENGIMNKNLNSVAHYVETLAQDARSLIAATSDVAEENVRHARKRLSDALCSGGEVYDRLRDEAKDKAKLARETVQDNPLTAVAVLLVIGGLIALLVTRRRD